MKSFFNKKTYLFIGALVALLLITPDVTHAQGVTDLLKFVDPTYYIGKLFELIVLPLAAGAMAFTGMILDYAVRFSLGTAYIFGNLTVINQSWVVIRDICNLFFIFTLIWISIQTIVNLSNFDTKRRLTQLIIAALIINFSLYFTKVFVDVSNIFGNWLYGGILASLKANGASTSISALIASKLEIFRLWEDPAGNAALLAKTLNDSGIITPVLKLIVVLVATYVFMYTAILFMTRAVTIIFLLVLSPIGFIGGLLPQIEEYSKKWWGELVDAVTFPIVYLLMLYISLQLINNMEASSVWASFFSGNPAVVAGIDTGKVFKYIIVICALLICLKVAKDSAGQLGKAAGGFAGSVSKFSTSIGGASAALVGKYTVGAAAARAANSKTLDQLIASGGVGGLAATAVKGKLSSAADFHFDPRASIKEFGVKGGKGYVSTMKEQQKAQEEAMKNLAPSKTEKEAVAKDNQVIADTVYGRHDKWGDTYNKKAEEVKSNKDIIDGKKPGNKEAALSAMNKAKNDMDSLRGIIDEDKTYDATGKMYQARTNTIESLQIAANMAKKTGNKDSEGKIRAQISAMESVIRQEKAARAAADGAGIRIAKSVDKMVDSLPEFAKLVTAPVTGLAQAAAKQYVGDVDKTVKKLRETMKADDGKKEQDKIAKMLAKMTGAEAPETPKPATPPSGGGTSTGSTGSTTTI